MCVNKIDSDPSASKTVTKQFLCFGRPDVYLNPYPAVAVWYLAEWNEILVGMDSQVLVLLLLAVHSDSKGRIYSLNMRTFQWCLFSGRGKDKTDPDAVSPGEEEKLSESIGDFWTKCYNLLELTEAWNVFFSPVSSPGWNCVVY